MLQTLALHLVLNLLKIERGLARERENACKGEKEARAHWERRRERRERERSLAFRNLLLWCTC